MGPHSGRCVRSLHFSRNPCSFPSSGPSQPAPPRLRFFAVCADIASVYVYTSSCSLCCGVILSAPAFACRLDILAIEFACQGVLYVPYATDHTIRYGYHAQRRVSTARVGEYNRDIRYTTTGAVQCSALESVAWTLGRQPIQGYPGKTVNHRSALSRFACRKPANGLSPAQATVLRNLSGILQN